MNPEIDLVRVLLSFLLVVGLVGIFALGLRKFSGSGAWMAKMREGARIQVVEQTAIDGRRRIVLFKCDAKEYIAIVSPESHTLIEHKPS